MTSHQECGDANEPNNTPEQATLTDHWESGQVLDGDVDYFAVDIAAGERATFFAQFDGSTHDLDMTLWIGGDWVDDSATTSDEESIVYTNTSSETVRVQLEVFHYQNEGICAPFQFGVLFR